MDDRTGQGEGMPPAGEAPSTTPPPFPPPPSPSGPRHRKRGSGRRLVLVAAAVVLLVALLAAGAIVLTRSPSSSTAATSGGSTATPSSSPSVGAPATLSASPSGLKVTLSWTAVPRADVYDVFRDGSELNTVFAPGTSYVDGTVQPGRRYAYEVKAVSRGVMSEAAGADVEVPTLSLAQARVIGDYNVAAKDAGHSGFSKFTATFTDDWQFTPKCAAGPCDLAWLDVGAKSFKAKLKRHGAEYKGSDKGDNRVQCGTVDATTTLTVDIHVAKAQAVDGVWTATKLTGTLQADTSAQLGCTSSHATYHLTLTQA